VNRFLHRTRIKGRPAGRRTAQSSCSRTERSLVRSRHGHNPYRIFSRGRSTLSIGLVTAARAICSKSIGLEINRFFVATMRLSRVMLTGVPQPRYKPQAAGWAATNLVGGLWGVHQAVRASAWRRGCRDAVRRDEDSLAVIRTCTAGLFRSETMVGRGRQGLLLEDDAAVRVQSGRAFVPRARRIAKLIAGDGRMNVANERPSVESDEETFMDQHGRSLHLVGAYGCMNRIDLASIAGRSRSR
jgi:hypothetical protein